MKIRVKHSTNYIFLGWKSLNFGVIIVLEQIKYFLQLFEQKYSTVKIVPIPM